MKVFLSYGHDQNAWLVERIARDLEAAGHKIWIDTAEIKAGDHWRRSIVDGLADTDWTLGFLSRHSTRDPGVCLDELAIALHVKGGTIATVLVEAEAEVTPPVSLSHIQWLDMHDWAARHAAGGAEWETWYRSKLAEILALLASPAAQHFAGEIEELERRLKPIAQEAEIGVLVDGFVGRVWLRDRLDAWRRTALASRLFWVSGPPGAGKSAFSAWLAHHGRVNVIGLNLCRYNVEDRRDPGRVLRTLAFQIATRLADYRRLLLDRLRRQDPDGAELARKSPAALFDWLLAQPLRYGIDGGRREDRYLVVIDALDETVRDGRSELAEVLAESVLKLPPWMALVVTSRPELPILRQFAGFQPQTIDALSPENLEDLRSFARDWLAARPGDQRGRELLVERVVAASVGNFLYLRKLREAVEAGLLDLGSPEALPQGLVGLYERWFRRQFPDPAAYEPVVPLLEVLVAARQPVPEKWLARLFGWSKREQARLLAALGSLFERRADGIAPFHKSLRDWLVDDRAAGADFVVDAAAGSARLIAGLWDGFLEWTAAKDGSTLDGFCARELPQQVLAASRKDVGRLVDSGGPWPGLWEGLAAVANQLTAAFAWEAALAWWRMAGLLAESAGSGARAQRCLACRAAGDILRTLGRRAEAKEAYASALALAQALVAEDPKNSEWRRALFAAELRAGNMFAVEGNSAKALEIYREAEGIIRALLDQNPADAALRRGRFVALERLADILKEQGDIAGALAALREGEDIIAELCAAAPADKHLRRESAVNAAKIGDVLMDLGDLSGALAAYRKGLAIVETASAEEPENALWQRDLYASLTRIGDVHYDQAELDAALAAYTGAADRIRALCGRDPSNVGWRCDYHLGLARQSDVLRACNEPAAALAAARESLAIMRGLCASDPGNGEWEHHLVSALMRFGDLLAAGDDRAGAIRAYEEALGIARRLFEQDSARAAWQANVAYLLWGLAELGVNPQAYRREALGILNELKAQGRASSMHADWISRLSAELAEAAASG